MQLKIYNPSNGQPLAPVEWNFDEIKTWLADGLEQYKGRVYDETQINQAKKDAANLRKLKDAIEGKRKEVKAYYLVPVDDFAAKAKELTGMIDAQVEEITAQVKAFDEVRKQEKQEAIMRLYDTLVGNLAALVPYERLHNPKWLNVTTSMNTIADDIARVVDRVESGLRSIDTLGLAPDIAEQVKGVFLKNFDLAAALAEKERIEKRREELARYKAAQEGAQAAQDAPSVNTPPKTENAHTGQETAQAAAFTDPAPDETRYTVAFRVIDATGAQLNALKEFLKTNGIKFGRA